VDVPFQTGYSYASPTADESTDGLAFAPSLWVLTDVDNGVWGLDYERDLVRINFVISTPEIPANSTGIEFEQGLCWRDGANAISDVFATQDEPTDYEETLFTGSTGLRLLNYFNLTSFLYEGEQLDDPIFQTYDSDDFFTETLDLGEVRTAARLNRSGSAGFWRALTTSFVYSLGSSYVTRIEPLNGAQNNFSLVLGEWFRFAGRGMQGLECNFVPFHDAGEFFFPFPDTLVKTSCVETGGAETYFLPNSASFDVSSGLQFVGLFVDRDSTILPAQDGENVKGSAPKNPITIDGKVFGGGASQGVTFEDVESESDDSKLFTMFLTKP
jgi:hypothetical protein